MKIKLVKFFIILVCIHMSPFNTIKADKNSSFFKYSIIPAEQTSIKTVIFDLGDVLVATSKTQHMTALCMLSLQHPSVLYTLATTDIKKELFSTLHAVPATTTNNQHVMYNQGKQMPQIMIDWLTGRSNIEVLAATLAYISQQDNSPAQKALLCKIIQRIFEPKLFVQSLYLINSMKLLAESLKKHGYQLYILSNWDSASFPLLLEKYQSFFSIFDGIMISGNEGMGKPNPAFYQKLLQTYNIQADQTIFIDDEQYNVQAAKDLGIHGILYNSIDSVIPHLYQLGIVKLTE